MLEAQSLWYRYKAEVWLSSSPQTAVVHNIMRTLRAIRNMGSLAYVSAPITTGKYWYNLQLENPSTDTRSLLEQAIKHNYLQGWIFVESLQKRIGHPILYPADLTPVHQKWEQAHFLALWLSIIAERCTEVHMLQDWEYSNGCVEEFTHVMQLRLGIPRHKDLAFYNTKEDEKSERERMRTIKVYDSAGCLINLEEGVQAIKKAAQWTIQNHFDASKLTRCVHLLQAAQNMLEQGFYQ